MEKTNKLTDKSGLLPQFRVQTNLRSGATGGGGYVGGVYYPDQSGVCGGTTPPAQPVPPTQPTPPTSGGGYVGDVWYPDRSGSCG